MEKGDELQELRARVDAVDGEILDALAKRTALVKEIGRYKRAHNIEALDEGRRDALLKKWIERGETLGLSKEFMASIIQTIHSYSVSVEKKS
ncbi:MAG: chorismate mutase [Patescibacteria group bacterium]